MLKNLFKRQFLPTMEDIENKDVKKLAKRLKGRSDKETLTNVLEWQERNVKPWIDRWYMFTFLYVLPIASFYFLPIPSSIKWIVILVFILLVIFNMTIALSYFIPFLIYLIALSTWALSINPNMNILFPLTKLIILSIIFGGLLFLLLYLILKYRNIKSMYPEFKLGDTFKLSLPIEKILKYRLAVCRDYAKLTATLLLNLYPNNKIYFFVIPSHVAAGIKIKEKMYFLDQRLPILSSKKWLEYWKDRRKKKIIKANLIEVITAEGTIKLKNEKSVNSTHQKFPNIDTERLTNEAAKILGIEQNSRKKEADFKVHLKNYAICYDKDEIVEFSILRSIKNKLIDEFCGNSNKISKIDLVQEKKDLILKTYTRT